MPRRTDAELERMAAEYEEWAENVDPKDLHFESLMDLNAVAVASDAAGDAEDRLLEAVRAARANGRNWAEVGRALGVSRQAARQRFAGQESGHAKTG